MRRIFLILSIFIIAFSISAQTITVLITTDPAYGKTTHYKEAERLLRADFPNAKIKLLGVDTTDGSTVSMDALLAAGRAPNIYYDAVMRTSKYMIPEYALPLDGLIRDIGKYKKDIMADYYKNGRLLGLPEPGGGFAMCLNMDILREVGYDPPANWTTDDFLKMCSLVKAKYGDKYIISNMHAANQSGDYIVNMWYASFGVNWYNNKNYDVSHVSDNGGAKVYAFFQELMKRGYIPANSATMTDDDRDAEWCKGNVVSTGYCPGWLVFQDSAIQQGTLAKKFDVKFVPFPRAAGIKKVPLYYYGAVYIVHKTGADADKVAARFVEYANGAWWQDFGKELAFPNRIDVTGPTNKHMIQIAKLLEENGVQDVGITDPRFTGRRAVQFEILQRVLQFKVSPEQGAREFQEALNAVK